MIPDRGRYARKPCRTAAALAGSSPSVGSSTRRRSGCRNSARQRKTPGLAAGKASAPLAQLPPEPFGRCEKMRQGHCLHHGRKCRITGLRIGNAEIVGQRSGDQRGPLRRQRHPGAQIGLGPLAQIATQKGDLTRL